MSHIAMIYIFYVALLPPIVHGYELQPEIDQSVTNVPERARRGEVAEIEISRSLVQNVI